MTLPFPILETQRLLLTELRPSDAPDVLDLFSDPRVVEYYDLQAMTASRDAEALIQRLLDRYESGQGIRWAIRPRSTGRLVGTCGFNTWSAPMRNAVLGYDLNSGHWGQGLVFEAVSAIIDSAFSGALPCGELNRIQADTIPGNTRSESVLRRLGFQEEGLRREAAFWKGRYHDLKCFGLLKREYRVARLRTEP